MLDGLLFFMVLDMWRVIIPLGLSIMWVGTCLAQQRLSHLTTTTLCPFLCVVTYRSALVLAMIIGVVGFLVPGVLGYSLPEGHVAEGPLGYEEIFGYAIALALLWRMQRPLVRECPPSTWLVGSVMILFLGIALLWMCRWDVVAHAGMLEGGWFLGNPYPLEWARLVPKILHVLCSALIVGGIIVALFGLSESLLLSSGYMLGDSDLNTVSPDVVRYGVGWILAGLVPQIFIGPWLFLMLSSGSQGLLVEGATLTSVVFFVSLTTALLALVLLNASFMAPYVKGLVWGGLVNVAITLILMGIVRYETIVATLTAQRIPLAVSDVTWSHIVSVFVLMGLVGAILIRWCVWPPTMTNHAARVPAQLDKV